MEQIIVLKSMSGIFFEPDKDLPENFIKAKDGCNSRFLKSGTFSQYSFNKHCVVEAQPEERAEYIALKDRSKHWLNFKH